MSRPVNEIVSLLPVLIFVIPTVVGILILALGRAHRVFREGLALLGLGATFAISVQITGAVLGGQILTAWNMTLYVDALSALMELLGALIGIIVVIHSLRSVGSGLADAPDGPRRMTIYYGLLLVFLGMMNWTCATNNMVMLYVSLEATTLATAFLVTFYWKRESLEAGYKYLMLVSAGVIFSLFGCALIYTAGLPYLSAHDALLLTGIGEIAAKLPPELRSVILLASAFFIAGFGTKAGLVPFHAWLPDAHSEAPAPISALLSGVVIKVGAYALARTVSIFAPTYPAVVIFVAILSSMTMLVGIVMAWSQDDIKRLLAFHSVSQMGYIVEGLGMGTYLGIYGGLFHLLNHTLFKALLFLCAGAVIYATGVRKMSQLGGLARKMPMTATCFFIGVLAISGLPPCNGMWSKFTLFMAAADRGLLWAAVISAVTSLLTLTCMTHAAYRIFWGKPRPEAAPAVENAREVPMSMWAGMAVLAGLCLLIGLRPQIVYPLLDAATRNILHILGIPGGG
jgi:formate hydrogenlyase subunit 3/multisubunit Na+/H+ antiporter MnhD subunit